MKVLVIAEHSNAKYSLNTLNTIKAAQQIHSVSVLVAGFQCQTVAQELSVIEGVEEILLADHQVYQNPLAENLAPLIIDLIKNYSFTHVFAPASTFGKNVMPRVAGTLKLGQISDITAIVDQNTYQRPIYAGNAIASVRSKDPIQLITVRPTAFGAAQKSNSTPARITETNFAAQQDQVHFIRQEQSPSDRPELSSAEIVISGGRGLGNKANFEKLALIASRLNAALGASRAAVDAGLAPNDWQVGQTGKVVAPKLYIAVGISGAIQHIAGMKESQVIVAINKDPDAPIFQIADYGLVADIATVLSEWEIILNRSESC